MKSSADLSKQVELILSDASRLPLADYIRKGIFELYRSFIPEFLVGLFGSILYFGKAFSHALPIGYAGLCPLMMDEVVVHNFQLPDTIPCYGPGGIPFAYPPLAIHIGGFLSAFITFDSWYQSAPLINLSLAYLQWRLVVRHLANPTLAGETVTDMIHLHRHEHLVSLITAVAEVAKSRLPIQMMVKRFATARDAGHVTPSLPLASLQLSWS